MTFLDTFKHLLPNARAWRITVTKTLRSFFSGLTGVSEDTRTFLDGVYTDLDPAQTRELDAWERQFALASLGLTEQQRRDRLDGAWKALGGQDPNYVQTTLRSAGFDVYVHEWWAPGTEPPPGVKACVTPRNPTLVLRRDSVGTVFIVECGEAVAECGEADAEAGNSLEPRGYPLVNKVFISAPDIFVTCGEANLDFGEAVAECGNFNEIAVTKRNYVIPVDPAKWPYFLYIGAQTYGDIAQVDPKRRDEFENLCLRICPAQQWLGILVEYV